MRPIRLASRYAKALFDLAAEQNIQDEVFRDMSLLVNVSKGSREFRRMLQSPVIKFDKKNSVLKALFGQHFHKITLAYLDIVTRKRREMILDEIAEQYIIMYRDWKGIISAHFATAVAVSDELNLQVRQLLSKQLNAEIELSTEVRDNTIRKKISRLTKEFNVNIYERKF
jgi:F-type H+-transporting ATPase subunit delta